MLENSKSKCMVYVIKYHVILQTWTTTMATFWGYSLQPHDYKFKEFVKISNSKTWQNHYTRHAFCSCLIRCVNVKWIWQVLLKIQSGHDSVHSWTDGWTDGWTDEWTDEWTDTQMYNVKPVPPFLIKCSWNVKMMGCLYPPNVSTTARCPSNLKALWYWLHTQACFIREHSRHIE